MTRRKTGTNTTSNSKSTKPKEDKIEYSLGVDMKTISAGSGIISIYENKNYTMTGDIRGYDVEKILRNKQDFIYQTYDLMNYYVESDEIFNSIIKKVLTPFSTSSGWKLHGASEKVKQKYLDYFDQIGLNDLLRDIFYEINLYGQCYIYDRDGLWFDILPVHRIRVNYIGINGQPILEYKIIENANLNYTMAKEEFINTLLERYKGYPPEILEGVKNGTLWVQLNPLNIYSLSDLKSRYERYSMPIGVACLKSFNKKNLISEYENAQLNLGQKNFLLVNVGDKDIAKTVSNQDLQNVGKIFKDAISGFPMACVSWNVSAKWIQTDSKELFTNKYATVNSAILSAAGISAIIATGDSKDSSFSTAQVNVNTLEKRIIQNQKNVCEFIKWIINKRAIEWRISNTKTPSFIFNPINLANDSSFKDEVVNLFKLGLLSRETTLDNLNFDFNQEKERKSKENDDKLDELFTVPPNFNTTGNVDNKGGAPTVPNADGNKSATGKNPKPSTT